MAIRYLSRLEHEPSLNSADANDTILLRDNASPYEVKGLTIGTGLSVNGTALEATTYTFTNGLTESSGTVKLGGALTDATTTISGGAGEALQFLSQNAAGDTNTTNIQDAQLAISATDATTSDGSQFVIDESQVVLQSYDDTFTVDYSILNVSRNGINLQIASGNSNITLDAGAGTGDIVLTRQPQSGAASTDEFLFRDNVNGELRYLTIGTGLAVSGTTLQATASGGPSFGTDNQIPYTNLGGTDFDYTSSFSYDSHVLNVGANLSTTTAALQIGNGRTGSGFSYIDLVGDTTYTDYGLRIIRSDGGANTTSQIDHRGTGDLIMTTNEAADIRFDTANTERLKIAQGKIFVNGEGSGGPGLVNINSIGAVDGTAALGFHESSHATEFEFGFFTNFSGGGETGNSISFGTNITGWSGGKNIMTWRGDGNVGIGTTSPSANLDVTGTSGRLLELNSNASSTGYIEAFKGGVAKWYIGDALGSTDELRLAAYSTIPIKFQTNGAIRLTLDSSGRFYPTNGTPSGGTGVYWDSNGNFQFGSGATSTNTWQVRSDGGTPLFTVQQDTGEGYFYGPMSSRTGQIGRTAILTNTSANDANKWTKFAQVTITAQYGNRKFTGEIASSGSSSGEPRTSKLEFGVKQQNTFGNDPFVSAHTYYLDTNLYDIGYVIVQNTPSTIVEFYIKVKTTYQTGTVYIRAEEGSSSSVIWYDTQAFATTVTGLVSFASQRIIHSDVDGFVGIGTDNPSAPLHVSVNTTTNGESGIRLYNSNASGGTEIWMNSVTTGLPTGNGFQIQQSSNGTVYFRNYEAQAMYFRTSDVNRFYISGSQLYVPTQPTTGNTSDRILMWDSAAGQIKSIAGNSYGTGSGTIGGSISDNQIATGASTSNNIEGSSNFVIESGRLECRGSSTTNLYPLVLENTNTSTGNTTGVGMEFNHRGTYAGGNTGTGRVLVREIDANDYRTYMEFYTQASDSNTVAPQFNMRLRNDGQLHVRGTVIGSASIFSDIKVKDIVGYIDQKNALNVVLGTKGVDYKDKYGDEKHLLRSSYIAQDIEKVLPHIVTDGEHSFIEELDGETVKQISPTYMLPYITEAIKEQQRIIEEQQKQIDKLIKLVGNG